MLPTQIPQYTFSRLKGTTNNGGGSGWSLEGKQFFDSLQGVVRADRHQHATAGQADGGMTFNKELYQRFQLRRDTELYQSQSGNQDKPLKQKPPAYQCVDEFDDESDEEAEQQCNAASNLNDVTEYEEI